MIQFSLFPSLITACLLSICAWTNGQPHYSDIVRLENDIFQNYNPRVRPKLNQSEPIEISIDFVLMSILDIDQINQVAKINGFFAISWTDELLRWNASDYSGVNYLTPDPTQIWRPRLQLVNTAGVSDLWKDDYCWLRVSDNGFAIWGPGGAFQASSPLDLSKFPYDKHTISFELVPMLMSGPEASFASESHSVVYGALSQNGEWKVEESSLTVEQYTFSMKVNRAIVSVTISRRPEYFTINFVVPVALLTLLNGLVFLIPVESGEKISFSLTVLLSITVYMTIVSSGLPTVSVGMPIMTYFLLSLVSLSILTLTVVIVLIIVGLHHKDMAQSSQTKKKTKITGIWKRILKPLRFIRRSKVLPKLIEAKKDINEKCPKHSIDSNDLNHTHTIETTQTTTYSQTEIISLGKVGHTNQISHNTVMHGRPVYTDDMKEISTDPSRKIHSLSHSQQNSLNEMFKRNSDTQVDSCAPNNKDGVFQRSKEKSCVENNMGCSDQFAGSEENDILEPKPEIDYKYIAEVLERVGLIVSTI